MRTTTRYRSAIAATAFRSWLLAGLALTAVFPALRNFDPILGWWPMWLVVLPLACLLLMGSRPAELFQLAVARQRPHHRRRQAVRYRFSR